MKNDISQPSRRGFLQGLAVSCAVLVVHEIPMAQAAEVMPDGDEFHRIKSGESRLAPWTHHFHFLDVPLIALENPPAEGIQLHTTKKLFHSHTVMLTQADLISVASGETVTVTDTVGDHLYAITLC